MRGRGAPVCADLSRQERRGEGPAPGLADHLLGNRRGRHRQGGQTPRLRGGHPQLPALSGGLSQSHPVRAERPALHPLRRPLDALGGRGGREPQRRRPVRPEGPRSRRADQARGPAQTLGPLQTGGRRGGPALLLHRRPAARASAPPPGDRRQRRRAGPAPPGGVARRLGPVPSGPALDLRSPPLAGAGQLSGREAHRAQRAPAGGRPSPPGTGPRQKNSTAPRCATWRSSPAPTACGRGPETRNARS